MATAVPAPAPAGPIHSRAPTAYTHANEARVPHGRLRRAAMARRLETLAIVVLFGLLYSIVGYHLITSDHVVVFDALDRLTRAYMVWHNDPPKLASIGFTFPPLTSMMYLPLTAIKPLASSLIAIPLTSALFAGGAIAMVNRTFDHCEMAPILRYPLLLLVAFNPMFGFYATNGMGEVVYLFFLAGALYGFVAWVVSDATRYLIFSGLAFSLAMLTRYEFIIWAAVMAVLTGAGLIRWRASQEEVEGSVIAFLAPIFYGLALWTLFNGLIVGKPFGWISSGANLLAANSDQTSQNMHASVGNVAQHLFEIVLGIAPLALMMIPLLLFLFISRREDVALWLAGFIALGIVINGVDALSQNRLGVLTLNDGLPVLFASLAGAAWAYRSLEGLRMAIWAGALVVLTLGLPLAWHRMQVYPYQNQEQAFVRAVRADANQEGTSSRGGYHVGIAPERAMAAFINSATGRGHHEILTDNAQTFGVIILSGRPQRFFDRVDKGDTTWRGLRSNPWGKVRYLLINYSARGDLLRQAYPHIGDGTDARFSILFRDARYVLARVPTTQPKAGAPIAGAGRSISSSQLFTPNQVLNPSAVNANSANVLQTAAPTQTTTGGAAQPANPNAPTSSQGNAPGSALVDGTQTTRTSPQATGPSVSGASGSGAAAGTGTTTSTTTAPAQGAATTTTGG